MEIGCEGSLAEQVAMAGRSQALLGQLCHKVTIPPTAPKSLPSSGMIGLDMFICCLLKVHFFWAQAGACGVGLRVSLWNICRSHLTCSIDTSLSQNEALLQLSVAQLGCLLTCYPATPGSGDFQNPGWVLADLSPLEVLAPKS